MDAEFKNLIYESLSLIVMTLLPVLLTILTAWLYRRFGVEGVNRAITVMELAKEIAEQAAAAMEQIAAKGGWTSPTKKAQAIVMAKALALQSKLQLSDEQWSTLIETAVKNLKDWREELKQPAPPAA